MSEFDPTIRITIGVNCYIPDRDIFGNLVAADLTSDKVVVLIRDSSLSGSLLWEGTINEFNSTWECS